MAPTAERPRHRSDTIDLTVSERKRFLEFDDDDVRRLVDIDELAQRYANPVIEAFYDHLLSFDEGKMFFADPAVLERVKLAQKEYFLRLTKGDYGTEYVENRLSIGAVHERIGLPVKSYLGMYCFYLREVARRLTSGDSLPAEEGLDAFMSLMKLVFLDIGLAIDTYILQRERTIDQQQESIHELQRQTIRELSTPVLQVREGLLILPIIGVVDSQRAVQITESLLQAIRANRAKVVVIDITGVATVDSAVANHIVKAVEASRLMGARVIVSGLSAEVAQTVVTIGVDLTKINTVGDMQGGIEEAERILGYRVVKVAQGSEKDG